MPNNAFSLAAERYYELGVDVEQSLLRLQNVSISMHCWQGDDVGGFESGAGLTGGGIQATGSYPGKARNADELRSDLDTAYRLIPGKHRLNLHAIYAEPAVRPVERDALEPQHFSRWVDWAAEKGHGLDFNPSFFSHPSADDGFTLTSRDEARRAFWVRHGAACRRIGAEFGRRLGTPCVTNIWIPDGYKDTPVDRKTPRILLEQSLDEILAERFAPEHHLDAVECKLFGIGSESYTAGSHEFYMGYAVTRKTLLCLDAGHFHPTETIADKISSVLQFVPRLLLHVSRGVRWDSDHVVVLNDDLRSIAEELVRGSFLDRTHIGLDFFDASIHRVAAWVIGTRCMLKALLIALLEPTEQLRGMEAEGDFTGRLALLEECRTLPFGAVWDEFCARNEVPCGLGWLEDVRRYERQVTAGRG
jgi:L-rhamnose isomerase